MEDPDNSSRRLETIAWGLLFMWWGARWWLLASLPNGTGLLGTGLILLGLNATRALRDLPAKRSTTIVGILALGMGGLLAGLELTQTHFELPVFETSLITLGILLLIRALTGMPAGKLGGLR